MATSNFRSEMLKAFSYPILLFAVFPFVVTLVLAPFSISNIANGLLTLLALVLPAYLTGYVLAPWAGARLPAAKPPAFLMSAAAALVSAVSLGVLVALSGSPSLSMGTAAIVALFALPSSLLGALLFIGGCERLRGNAHPKHGQV